MRKWRKLLKTKKNVKHFAIRKSRLLNWWKKWKNKNMSHLPSRWPKDVHLQLLGKASPGAGSFKMLTQKTAGSCWISPFSKWYSMNPKDVFYSISIVIFSECLAPQKALKKLPRQKKPPAHVVSYPKSRRSSPTWKKFLGSSPPWNRFWLEQVAFRKNQSRNEPWVTKRFEKCSCEKLIQNTVTLKNETCILKFYLINWSSLRKKYLAKDIWKICLLLKTVTENIWLNNPHDLSDFWCFPLQPLSLQGARTAQGWTLAEAQSATPPAVVVVVLWVTDVIWYEIVFILLSERVDIYDHYFLIITIVYCFFNMTCFFIWFMRFSFPTLELPKNGVPPTMLSSISLQVSSKILNLSPICCFYWFSTRSGCFKKSILSPTKFRLLQKVWKPNSGGFYFTIYSFYVFFVFSMHRFMSAIEVASCASVFKLSSSTCLKNNRKAEGGFSVVVSYSCYAKKFSKILSWPFLLCSFQKKLNFSTWHHKWLKKKAVVFCLKICCSIFQPLRIRNIALFLGLRRFPLATRAPWYKFSVESWKHSYPQHELNKVIKKPRSTVKTWKPKQLGLVLQRYIVGPSGGALQNLTSRGFPNPKPWTLT